MARPVRLYNHSVAPNPRRVRIFAAEKGIELKKNDAGPIRLSASFQVATVRSLGDKPRHELNAESKCGLESSNSN
jgi:hypothetical protein